MVDIKIKKGLDIPILGRPEGTQVLPLPKATHISLNLDPFDEIKFRMIAKVGDKVKIGEPIAEDKNCAGRFFVSPAGGVVQEIRRGEKRRILDVVIVVDEQEEYFESAKGSSLIETLKNGGYFAHIRQRPFNILANPEKKPRSIFVKAIESAPFVPPAEIQVAGHEADFQAGLSALAKLGTVHLVYNNKIFSEMSDVVKHTAEGPHPVANHSLHIQKIDPITSFEDVVWTLNAHDVVGIGYYLRTGKYFIERVIAIAGPGVIPDKVGYYRARAGYPVNALLPGRIKKESLRLISGDPLMGRKVDAVDFLGFNDYVFCVIPENVKRDFLHFFRLGLKKFTFSRAYAAGHLKNREYAFTTSLQGEHRAFIDSTLYDKVMPLNVSTMLLVKAIMAEDFELADQLGILEVDSEDFALPTFVCPSKMEMVDIVRHGLKKYFNEIQ